MAAAVLPDIHDNPAVVRGYVSNEQQYTCCLEKLNIDSLLMHVQVSNLAELSQRWMMSNTPQMSKVVDKLPAALVERYLQVALIFMARSYGTRTGFPIAVPAIRGNSRGQDGSMVERRNRQGAA
jgi:hypothetical protein